MKSIVERPIYLQKLIDRRNNGEIKIITGSRRSGKSWLLTRLYKNWLLSQNVKMVGNLFYGELYFTAYQILPKGEKILTN